MSLINKSFLQRRTERLLLENQSLGEPVSYSDTKTIGVLFTQSTRMKYDAVRNLIRQFKNDGKQVEVLCFLEKGGENFDFRYDYITSNDVGLWGKMLSSSAVKFSQKTFDYLFYLDLEENLYLEHVLAMTKASCRVGFYKKKNNGMLDLMINTNGSTAIDDAIQQVLYYTKKIGTDGEKV